MLSNRMAIENRVCEFDCSRDRGGSGIGTGGEQRVLQFRPLSMVNNSALTPPIELNCGAERVGVCF